ncbi:MAG: hypothetical protein LWY06_10260, partial [Firmicutes bacterium]|nr:hypothetical protein [Bacillota bacterium]
LTDELSSFINVPVIDKGIEGAENTQTDVVYAPSQEELANGVDTDSDKPFYKKPVHIDNIERKLEKHHEENIQIQQTADGYEISVTPAKDGQTQMDIPESLFYMAGPFLLLTIMGFITFFVEKRSFFNKLYIEMFLVWLGLGIAIFIMVKNSFAKPMTVCINEKDLIFRIGKRITKSVKLDSITDIHTQVGIHETAWIEVYAMTDHITVRNSLKVPTCRALCREIRRLTAEIKSRPVE